MSRSLQTTSSGRCPSTQPWRSLSSASAAESRCASAFASAFSAMALASAATRAASSQAPALRCATAASRSQIACAISSGANSRAPSRVASWIRSSDCCSARSAAAICETGIAISIPGRTSETARSLARRISIQRSGSPRCSSARSRRLWPSSRTTTIGSSAALAVEPCQVSSDATITQMPAPSRAVLPTRSPPVSSWLRQIVCTSIPRLMAYIYRRQRPRCRPSRCRSATQFVAWRTAGWQVWAQCPRLPWRRRAPRDHILLSRRRRAAVA